MSAHIQLDAQKQKKEWAEEGGRPGLLGQEANSARAYLKMSQTCQCARRGGEPEYPGILSAFSTFVNTRSDWGIFQLSAPALLAKLSPLTPLQASEGDGSSVFGASAGGFGRVARGIGATGGLLLGLSGASAADGLGQRALDSVGWLAEGLLALGSAVLFFGTLYAVCRVLWWACLVLEVKGRRVREAAGATGCCPNCGNPISPGVLILTPGEEKLVIGQDSAAGVVWKEVSHSKGAPV